MVGLFSSLGLVFFNDDQKSFAQLTSSVKSYKVEGGTGTVAVNPNTNLVYVTNTRSDTVSVFDGTTNNLLSTFEVGRTPFGIGVNPNTNMLYVGLEHKDILAVVDGSTNEIVKNIEITGPYDIAVNDVTNMIYVTSKKAHSVFL